MKFNDSELISDLCTLGSGTQRENTLKQSYNIRYLEQGHRNGGGAGGAGC